MHSIAVVGIGNNLLQDDGAGVHALQYFEQHHADAGVYCLDAGTVGLALMIAGASSSREIFSPPR